MLEWSSGHEDVLVRVELLGGFCHGRVHQGRGFRGQKLWDLNRGVYLGYSWHRLNPKSYTPDLKP